MVRIGVFVVNDDLNDDNDDDLNDDKAKMVLD